MANFLKSLFVKGIEIDPAGATSAQVLSYNGTKFVPAAASGGGGGATTNASLLTTGTLDNARLPAVATTITTVGTLGSLAVTNGVTAATFTGALTGNASTASAVAAANLTGATLASGVTASSLTSVGTIGTGVWQGTVVAGLYGGTGIANSGKTITLGGNLTTSGAFATTLTTTAATSVTLPTTGTLATLAGTEILTNKTLTTPNMSRPIITAQGGSEGGEINLASPPSSSTITSGVNIDVHANLLRIFENGGTYRGMSIDITSLTASVGSTIATTDATQTFTNKTLTTPVLGVASATTINKVAFTAPATGSTLTIANGKTLTASNTLTLAGTDSTTMTFPATSSTVMTLATPGTLTGSLTLRAGTATASTAPLYLTSGTNLTTAAAGAMEFDGTNLYFSPSTTRKTVAFTDSAMTSSTFIGTTSVALNRSTGALVLTGITSIDGSAATLTNTRTLWGQNFNGSANVSGALTGATTVALSGATSGTTTVQASAVAGTTTITLPAATGTVALLGTIALGTDTTGNYMSGVTAGTGISVTHTPSEGSSATIALANTAVTAASYTNASITVDAQGRLTAASSGASATTVTGTSPVVSSGGTTPAISLATNYGDTQNPYASKTANYVLAAPNGTAGVPTFRAIVAADIPTLNQNTTGNAATATTATTATTASTASAVTAGNGTAGSVVTIGTGNLVSSATSSKIRFTTSTPTTGGNIGDIWIVY